MNNTGQGLLEILSGGIWTPTEAPVPGTGLGAPGAPTGVSATAADSSATISFDPPASDGGSPITSYTVTATDATNPAHGGQTVAGPAGPIIVTGLTDGDTYTFAVTATNGVGTGPPSNPSNAIIPTAATTRYVAFGDSVPYGHGLANPNQTSQIGLPAGDVNQGPSLQAYPSLVAQALGLNMNVRSFNCLNPGTDNNPVTDDQLSISGAPAADANLTPNSPDKNCGASSGAGRSVENTELPDSNLTAVPAKLVTVQAGADDIHFADCLTWEATVGRLGTQCVKNGQPTSSVATELTNLKTELESIIEAVSPHSNQVAVLTYYNPIPNPKDFKYSPFRTNVDPVCAGLALNEKGAYNDGVVIQSSLNVAIAQAVQAAHRSGYSNVTLVDISSVMSGHEMCTGNPALYSGETMSAKSFDTELPRILADTIICKFRCTAAIQNQRSAFEADITAHVWRAGHPNQYGQADIAASVTSQLRPLLSG